MNDFIGSARGNIIGLGDLRGYPGEDLFKFMASIPTESNRFLETRGGIYDARK